MIQRYLANRIPENCEVVTMPYAQYKQHYSDCGVVDGTYHVVDGTYHKINKTIEVVIPYGRIKNSGVRGKKFFRYLVKCADAYIYNENDIDEKPSYYFVARAVSEENAIKQAIKRGRTPLKIVAYSGSEMWAAWFFSNGADEAEYKNTL